MTDLSSLPADQLAEKVLSLVWQNTPADADAHGALDELRDRARRLKTAEDALDTVHTILGDAVEPYPPELTAAYEVARDALAAIRPNPKP